MDQIGARPCLDTTDEVKANTMKDMFIFLFEFIYKTIFLFIFFPLMVIYLLYRIGYKRMMRLFNRFDREYKRKTHRY